MPLPHVVSRRRALLPPRRPVGRRPVLVALLLAMAFAATSPRPLAAQPGPPGGAPPPPEVTFVVAAERELPIDFDFVGVTVASRVVEVRARVRGYLAARHFEEGALVAEGDLLYTIDPRQFEIAEEVAAATVAENTARLDLAVRERDRLRALKDSGAMNQSDLDRAEAEFHQATAALRLAEARLEAARLERSYTVIHAPTAGIVGKTMKEPGSLVDDGSNSLLTRVTRISPIYVAVHVSERGYLDFRARGAAGEIHVPAGAREEVWLTLQNGMTFPEAGRVNYEDPAFDAATGTFELRASFDNAERVLRPGQFGRVRLTGWTRPGSIAVPQRAVNQIASGPFVYVIGEGDVIEFRPVELGQWRGPEWVIRSGVAPGERVLVDGFLKVRPGVAVTPVALAGAGGAGAGAAGAADAGGAAAGDGAGR